MLHYPLQLPPPDLPKDSNNDLFRHQVSLTAKRFASRSPFSNLPLSLSTNLPPPPSPTWLSKSPYVRSSPSSRPVSIPNPLSQTPSRPSSLRSSLIEDVLSPGDSIGEGSLLQGEPLRLVSMGSNTTPSRADDYEEPAKEFQVVRRLGTGSYAVVYLVQEVLSRPPLSEDGHMPTIGQMELDGGSSRRSGTIYGREYAIKCLSKADLDEDALAAQMTEVTIHQSLMSHPNIVTLHQTLETSSFLFLVLEYVPGEDLFYFLEQDRDRYDSDSHHPDSHTPPTPSLLSNTNPSQLLSRTRLRLIASMFSQMCDAVAACHDQLVFHRDIKPENFIVTDGWTTLPDGRQERKVLVKLSDFGLSSTDIESSDMDCGSAPYMSYECRNNVAPTYRPRAADVWSLGIVLINMLYHCNPWTDTEQGACPSFELYLRDPVNFFMNRFVGITRPVAEFLASRVFCVLENPGDDSQRISAREFGLWVKNLPTLLGAHGMHRTVSNSSTQGHPLHVSMPASHRPSSRHPSGCASAARTPLIPPRSLSRAPSLGPAYEEDVNELSTVFDQEIEAEDQPVQTMDTSDAASRSTSHQRRRRRGTRKGKGAATSSGPEDDTLATLAGVTQNLAREISKTSMPSSKQSADTKSPSQRIRQLQEPTLMYTPPVPPLPTNEVPSQLPPPVTKKPSIWKLGFGKASAPAPPNSSSTDELVFPSSDDLGSLGSATATNVTNLIMSLNPVTHVQPFKTEDESWLKGRKSRVTLNEKSDVRSPISSQKFSERAISPHSSRSGRLPASSASSMASSNWRSSTSTTSSAGTSSSTFTRYSNSSTRSVSTAATSVSSASWRASVKSASNNSSTYSTLPKNIKPISAIPWELSEVPRGQHPNSQGEIFGSPPQPRKQRTRKQKDTKLDTINERPTRQKAVEFQRRDASTSTTDLSRLSAGKDENEQIKRVQKGQINTLAKMLSALRR